MVETSQPDTNPGGKPLEEALEDFVDSRRKTQSSGNYAKQASFIVGSWIDWCDDRNVTTVADISSRLIADYAQHLRRRARARASDPNNAKGITGNTAHQYFAVLRAFLTYCEEWGWIETNPAREQRVTAELPEKSLGSSDEPKQTWSEHEREQIVTYVEERAQEAIQEHGLDAEEPCRDRALVSILAFSGARGAEVVRDPDDDRRRGIYWSDIDFAGKTITVLGKNQDYEPVQFSSIAHSAVKQWKRVLDPPTDDWPVFPTRHAPTLYALIDQVNAELGPDQTALEFVREHEIAPPSITVQTARDILQDLCDAGAIDVEGPHEYLKPHGARRGVGKALYQNAGHESAQKALRHADPSTTSEMYADIKAGEVADVADVVFNPDE